MTIDQLPKNAQEAADHLHASTTLGRPIGSQPVRERGDGEEPDVNDPPKAPGSRSVEPAQALTPFFDFGRWLFRILGLAAQPARERGDGEEPDVNDPPKAPGSREVEPVQ